MALAMKVYNTTKRTLGLQKINMAYPEILNGTIEKVYSSLSDGVRVISETEPFRKAKDELLEEQGEVKNGQLITVTESGIAWGYSRWKNNSLSNGRFLRLGYQNSKGDIVWQEEFSVWEFGGKKNIRYISGANIERNNVFQENNEAALCMGENLITRVKGKFLA